MEDEVSFVSMKEVREGKFIMVDGIACKVVQIETSSPGKHGGAKMRITAIGVFDGTKHTIIKPSHGEIEVPVIKKKKAQVVSVTGDIAQLMDSDTYEVYEIHVPEEFKGKLSAGAEVEVMEATGKRMFSRVF